MPPRDHEAMADAIVRLLGEALRAAWARPDSRARSAQFSAERMVQDTLRVYAASRGCGRTQRISGS